MPNNVETRMWLVSSNGSQLSEKQIEDFFWQFISITPGVKTGEEQRLFDFNLIIPQPENIWLGNVGGDPNENIKLINELGGLDVVKQAFKEGKQFPIETTPALTDAQINLYGMVNGLSWNSNNWETKWGAYDCYYDFDAVYEDYEKCGSAHVSFYTAWNVPEKILRMVREKAIVHGFDIACHFGGEMDYPGKYVSGNFMYWDAKWNDKTHELKLIGDPMNVHA